jgi:hypothetical protein
VPEIGKLRSTWRELETRLWLPDCGPSRKRWSHHRRLPVRAPVLDPTDERDVETGLGRGYSGTARRKGRQQTNRTYGHRATSRYR